jgi:hypothetical protein
MPYKLRKVPKKDLYWVVSKESGRKHSKEGLPKQQAKAQMRALYAAESGAVMKGKALPTMKTSTLSTIARMGYKTGSELLTNVDGWQLIKETPNLRFYQKDGDTIVSVRGSKTLSDWTDSNTRLFLNKVREGKRYAEDRAAIEAMLQYAPVLFGVGHSLGGALIDEFIKDGLIREAVSFNPAVQPENWDNVELAKKNTRVYYEGDPVYEIMGRYTTGSQQVKAQPDDWIVEYAIRFPDMKKAFTSLPAAAKEALKTRIGVIPAGISLYAHQVSRFLPDDRDIQVMNEISKGIKSVRGGAVTLSGLTEGATDLAKRAVGAIQGAVPNTWTKEQWEFFFKYADAVVFDALSEEGAKEVVAAIITALALMPKFQAALAAGLTFWEAVGAILPLVTSAAVQTGLTFTIPAATTGAAPIVVSVAVAIAVFWAVYYAHEYLYPACNEELKKKGKPCNDLRTKSKTIDIWKELQKLKADVDKAEAERKKMKGEGVFFSRPRVAPAPAPPAPPAPPALPPIPIRIPTESSLRSVELATTDGFHIEDIYRMAQHDLAAIRQTRNPDTQREFFEGIIRNAEGTYKKIFELLEAAPHLIKTIEADELEMAFITISLLLRDYRARYLDKLYADETIVEVEALRINLREMRNEVRILVPRILGYATPRPSPEEITRAAEIRRSPSPPTLTQAEVEQKLRRMKGSPKTHKRQPSLVDTDVVDVSPTEEFTLAPGMIPIGEGMPKRTRKQKGKGMCGGVLPEFVAPKRPTSAKSKVAYQKFYINYLVKLYTESYVPLLSEKAAAEALQIAPGTRRLMLEEIDRKMKEVGDKLEEVKEEFVSNYDEKTWNYILGEAQIKAGLKARD